MGIKVRLEQKLRRRTRTWTRNMIRMRVMVLMLTSTIRRMWACGRMLASAIMPSSRIMGKHKSTRAHSPGSGASLPNHARLCNDINLQQKAKLTCYKDANIPIVSIYSTVNTDQQCPTNSEASNIRIYIAVDTHQMRVSSDTGTPRCRNSESTDCIHITTMRHELQHADCHNLENCEHRSNEPLRRYKNSKMQKVRM